MLEQVHSDCKVHFSYKDLHSYIQKAFCLHNTQALARKTKFISRSTSRLNGLDFLKAMVLASFDGASLSAMSDHLVKVNKKAKMTPQAVRQRINTQKAENFLYECSKHVLENKFKPLNQSKSLSYFSKVLIHDSSECELSEALKENFKGSGGGCASTACVKIDVIMELKNFSIQQILLTDRRQPDQKLNSEMIKHLTFNSLVIQDLGYFELDFFKLIDEKESFFLSRLHANCTVFLHEEDEKATSLSKLVKKPDIDVFIGKNKIKGRLIVYPVPEKVYQERMRKYQQRYKTTPSKEYKLRQRYTLLVTNVPRQIWPASIVGTIYKARWQIELLFKSWKSQLKLHDLSGTNPHRIRCLIYARLIALCLACSIHNRLYCLYEPSLHKVINWLKRHGRYIKIILNGMSKTLWNDLLQTSHLLLKETKRKRKTTLQYIQDEVHFLKTFNESETLCA